MSLSSIGDMRQHFLNLKANTSIRNDMFKLVEELTTGQAQDLTQHLGAGQTRLAGVDRQLQMLNSYAQANTETAQFLSTMQDVLQGVEGQRDFASNALLTIDSASTSTQINNAASVSLAGFESVVQSLNTRLGDRAMFGGNELEQSPLASADDMLTSIRAVVSGMTNAADVRIAVEDWFSLAGGPFETMAYQGSTSGNLTRTSAENQNVEILVRADDPALRETMTNLVLGSLANDPVLTLSLDQQQALQQEAAINLLTNATSLTGVQAQLGYAQGQVEQGAVRLSAQESSLGIARNNLVLVDPFETATRLEQVQLQLETHYTLTARLSRLSLTEYLR